jgi:Tol biopolymer transport system component/DNA-binding winged helix-turn-helix (wHTH) protein
VDAPVKSGRRISTGLFEIDLSSGEILRQGRRQPVQEQPFRVLAVLLEHPGQIVSREDLQASVWPADTYVGFDEGLNTAIRKLRILFGDSADNPRFIETIPRRGYRFIAPVTELPPRNGSTTLPVLSLNGSSHAESTPEAVSPLHEANGHVPTAVVSPRPRQRVWIWTLCFAAPVLLLLWLAAWYSRPRTPEAMNAVRITNDGKAKIPFLAPATDGPHLYFVEGQPINSGSGIAQISATGGETTWIPTSLRGILALPSISPDGSKLLVITSAAEGPSEGSEFWIQPLPAGAPFRVERTAGSSACFTPDGMHILYEDGERVMRVVNLDGSDPHTLATLPGYMHAPRYSPDGKRIRFWLGGPIIGSSRTIWEMESDGSHLHPLFPDWKAATDQCCGAWSLDGAWYYFQASLGNDQSIWVLPERRSVFGGAPSPFRLISGPLRFGGPSPSLDGKKLFVVGEEARVELFRYDPDAKRFDPYLGGLSAGPVDFSPDGKSIAYVSYPDMTLWRSRLDSSEKVQLTTSPVRAYGPRWSPNGSRIAFLDVQSGRPWTIHVINAEGGDSPMPVRALTGDGSQSDPTWTPDGKSIVFARSAEAGKGARAIFCLNLENGNLEQIPDSDQVYSPRLSPDGRFISALKADGNSLMLFDRTTNRWSTLAAGEQLAFNEWSRDGKYVYWRAPHEGSGHLVRVRIEDRVVEDVVDLKDFPALVDDFANWFGLTPDGGVLLMRDRSVQEIYSLELRFH